MNALIESDSDAGAQLAERICVMVVDDHAMVRHGMSSLINTEPDMHVVAEAEDGHSALSMLSSGIRIDILLLDMSLNENVEIDLIRRVNAIRPSMPILIVSMHNEKLYAEHAIQTGAKGYVMKHAPADQLILAIRTVYGGGIYLSQAMTTHLAHQRITRNVDTESQPIDRLTKSELEIMQLIASGMNTIEIANHKHRSIKTVETHRANIRMKLNLKDSADLIRCAVRLFPPLDWHS